MVAMTVIDRANRKREPKLSLRYAYETEIQEPGEAYCLGHIVLILSTFDRNQDITDLLPRKDWIS